jgi:hypothetical protein
MSFYLSAIAFTGDCWNTSRARFRAGVSSPLKHACMRNPYYRAKTVDDLLRHALESINKYGEPIKASKGHTKEITGVVNHGLISLPSPVGQIYLSTCWTIRVVALLWLTNGGSRLEYIESTRSRRSVHSNP